MVNNFTSKFETLPLVILIMLILLQTHASAAENGADKDENLMVGRNPQRTSWDNIPFQNLSYLNRINASLNTGSLTTASICNGSLFIASEEGFVFKINASNASQIIERFETISPANQPVCAGNRIIIGCWSGDLFILSENLEEIEHLSLPDSISTPPLFAEDKIYVSTVGGTIYHIDSTNLNNIISEFSTDGIEQGMSADEKYLYAGTISGTVHQLNLTNISHEINSFSATKPVSSALLLLQDSLYFSLNDGSIYQLNAENISTLIAVYATGTPVRSPISANNDSIFFSSVNGTIFKANANNISSIIDVFSLEVPLYTPPVLYDAFAYYSSQDGKIFQVNQSNLSQIVSIFDVEQFIDNPLSAGNNYVYFGTNAGTIFQLNSRNLSLDNIDLFVPSYSYNLPVQGTLHKKDIKVNISIIEPSTPVNAEIYLFDADGVLISNNSVSGHEFLTSSFFGLGNGTYYINATLCDSALNCICTETLTVNISIYEDYGWKTFRNNNLRTGKSNEFQESISGLNQQNKTLGSFSKSSPALSTGLVFIGSNGGLHVFNATNISQEIFYFNSSPITASPSISGNFIYFGTSEGYFYQINMLNKSVASLIFLGAPISSTAAIANSYVYVGSESGIMFQLSADNVSDLIAEYDSKSPIYSSPLESDGHLYFGTENGTVFQLNSSNINLAVATYNTDNWITSTPSANNESLYIGSNDGHLYQLALRNVSQLISMYNVESNIDSTCAISSDAVYVGANDGCLYQFDAANIALLKGKICTGADVYSSPAITNNHIFVANKNGQFFQLSANNVSEIIEIFSSADGLPIFSSPAVGEDYVYFASSGGTLYQLNNENVSLPNKDVYPPTISFTEPTTIANSVIRTSTIIANVTADDIFPGISNISIYVYNSNYTLVNFLVAEEELSLYANFSYLPDGQYYFEATVCDFHDNCNSTEQRAVLIDGSAPIVQINYTLIENNVSRSDLIVNVSVFDQTFMNLSILLYDKDGNIVNYMDSVDEDLVNFSNLEDGTYNLVLQTCEYNASCINSTLQNITIDNTLPILELFLIDEPSQDNFDDFQIVINASDSFLQNISLTIYDKRNKIVKSEFIPTNRTLLNYGNLPDGEYTLEAIACDYSGNCRVITLRIIIKSGIISLYDEHQTRIGTSSKRTEPTKCDESNCSRDIPEIIIIFPYPSQRNEFPTDFTSMEVEEGINQPVNASILNISIINAHQLQVIINFEARENFSQMLQLSAISRESRERLTLDVFEPKPHEKITRLIDVSLLRPGSYDLILAPQEEQYNSNIELLATSNFTLLQHESENTDLKYIIEKIQQLSIQYINLFFPTAIITPRLEKIAKIA